MLTHLLIDLINESTNGKIITVASIGHILGEINFDDINSDKRYNKYYAYFQSKLANILFSRELANRLRNTNIKVYCLHPGFVNTDLGRHLIGLLSCLTNLFNPIVLISPELGSQTTLYCALNVSQEFGHYYAYI